MYTTGDQSLAEAMWMGKALASLSPFDFRQVPCVKPDAKALSFKAAIFRAQVQQWHLALVAKLHGVMEQVPDLGDQLRQLVTEEPARQRAVKRSRERSEVCEKQIVAQLGHAGRDTGLRSHLRPSELNCISL